MTPNECISIAAAMIGDSSFAQITKEEYASFLNQVAADIWLKAKALSSVRQYLAPEGLQKVTLPDRDIIAFHQLQVRTAPTPAIPDGANLYDAGESPVYVREKSAQQNLEDGLGYYKNIGEVSSHYHLTVEFNNGVYTLHSDIPFGSDIIINAYVYVHSPRFTWQIIQSDNVTGGYGNTLTDNNTPSEAAMLAAQMGANLIWDPFQNVFITGIVFRAAQQHRTYVQNAPIDSMVRENMDLYYKKYLPDAIHFIHGLKDSTAGIQVRPFKYLLDSGQTRLY